jgi:aldose 1-epimerase
VGVPYTLSDENKLFMDVHAHSDADTYVNFTNHAYFNLAGAGSGRILDHNLWLNSTEFLEAGEGLCPTGHVADALGGTFDFTTEKPIGRDIDANDPQLITAGGYDHCFVLQKQETAKLSPAAAVHEPNSGRRLWVYTTQPGIQLYTGNFLADDMKGKGGAPLWHHGGFCLETQHYPCSPSHPDFPTTLLPSGDKFHEVTTWQFGW